MLWVFLPNFVGGLIADCDTDLIQMSLVSPWRIDGSEVEPVATIASRDGSYVRPFT